MIDPDHPNLSITRQCELVGLPRSTWYYEPLGESSENLALMRQIDELYLKRPFYGSRKMADVLGINRKRAGRLMRLMGIEAIYPKKRTTWPAAGHKIYPYLLRNVAITRPDQVWSTDITYIPMQHGFLYLVAVMDWYGGGPQKLDRSIYSAHMSAIVGTRQHKVAASNKVCRMVFLARLSDVHL